MTRRLSLGIDVGGTNIRLAVVDENGNILDSHRHEARLSQHAGVHDAARTAERVIDLLEKIIRPVLDKHPGITGVGIGFPGFFESKSGLLLSSPNIPGLYNFPLGEHLGTRLGLCVQAQNDASLAALGEFSFGVGKGGNSLLHLTLGTGVGGGAIIDGKLYVGDGGMAMEIGHLRVAPVDEPGIGGNKVAVEANRVCGCGARGCLETWASATAVAERFMALSGMQADARRIGELADSGNELAILVLHDAGCVLGRGIAESVKLLDIRTVSISGGLTGAWKHLAPAMQQGLDAYLLPPLIGRVCVQCSRLGDDAGILGAAALALQHA